MNDKASLRVVMMSGDWIPISLPERIKEYFPDAKQFSLGGATEASIWSIYYPIEKRNDGWKSIPYGMPLSNQMFYVLDSKGRICPVGVPGELYIGGAGIAKEYLNDREKTDYAFINHAELGYIYRTGDYGVMHQEGYIEFLGRKDRQVKVNGYRIEIGDIEKQLNSYEDIRNALVVVQENEAGSKSLMAYLESNKILDFSHLKHYLSNKIPEYMVPQHFIQIESLPLTANGKVDIKRLPNPETVSKKSQVKRTAPKNETEKRLLSIWSKILGTSDIDVKDSFFDIGGDSLKATLLATTIKKEFGIKLPLNIVFKERTVLGIAKYIIKNTADNEKDIDNVILLRDGRNKDKNLFLIHAGSGEVEVYVELVNRLSDDFNYWGIQQDKLKSQAPENFSVEEMAKKYLVKIREIQNTGPYYLAGWCVGGTVAFEITRILEESGEKVAFVGLFNSLAPQRGLLEDEREFCYETELSFIKKYYDIANFSEVLGNMSPNVSLPEIWNVFMKHLQTHHITADQLREKVPEALARLIPRFSGLSIEQLIYYTSLFRTSQNIRAFYIPQNNVDAPVHMFDATEERTENKDRWNIYTNTLVKVYDVQGNHVSIWREPNIDQVADTINRTLINS